MKPIVSLVLILGVAAVQQDSGPPLQLISRANSPDDGVVREVQVEGNLAILATSTGFVLYDMATPRSPRRLGSYAVAAADAGLTSSAFVFAAARRRALVSVSGGPAQIIDFGNAAKPKALATYTPRGAVRAALIGANYAALAYEQREPKLTGGIELFDMTDGANPKALETIDLGAPVSRMFRRGSRIVAAHPDGAISVLDVRVNRPVLVGQLPGDSASVFGPPWITVSGDGRLLYLTRAHLQAKERAALTVIDLKDPAAPSVAARLAFPIAGSSDVPVVVQGNRVMIMAGAAGGVMTVDTRDPAQPVIASVRSLPAGVLGRGLGLDDIHLLVAAGDSGVFIFQQPAGKR